MTDEYRIHVEPKVPTCPKCGSPMAKRTNHRTNDEFWGCSHYPDCKGSRDIISRRRSRSSYNPFGGNDYDDEGDDGDAGWESGSMDHSLAFGSD